MTSSPLSDTLTELNELCRFFLQAEVELKEGHITDASNVDERVSNVCKTVETALPDQQKEFLPLLTTLIDLLNSYEQSLRGLQNTLEKDESEQSEQSDHAGS